MLYFLVAVAVFTLIIMTLVAIILSARAQLVPEGNAKLVINGERELEVGIGAKLVNALIANELFVSAACGGKGSCGQCRVKVFEGGGDLLPVEASHITKRHSSMTIATRPSLTGPLSGWDRRAHPRRRHRPRRCGRPAGGAPHPPR